jgi:hypothetical protein
VAVARREYLALLDSDDLLFPCTLATHDQLIRTCNSPPTFIGSMIHYGGGQPIPAEPQVSRPVEILSPDFLSKQQQVISGTRLTSLFIWV